MPEKTPVISSTAIFIMPAHSRDWQGAEGLWVTTAGWAAAAKKKLGDAIIITRDRIASPEEALEYPLKPRSGNKQKQKWNAFLPSFSKIFVKDIIAWNNSRKWKILDSLDCENTPVAFVWEKHDLFSGRGIKLARRLKVPYISYVHAPVVWVASKWGVKRYFWGKLLQRREAAVLKKADSIAVVSKEVQNQLIEMGVEPEKIFISPMAVDPDYFSVTESERAQLRNELHLEGKKVVGWLGSFRNFHGLDQLIKGFKEISVSYPYLRLLLVGDGAERNLMERLVEELKLSEKVIFTGRRSFREITKYISLFDVAVVSARSATDFHYSPQKLREYMAAGKPVLAPNAGEISLLFKDEVHLKLFEVGNERSIVDGIEFFLGDESRKNEIAEAGKDLILRTGTWDHELEKCLNFLQS